MGSGGKSDHYSQPSYTTELKTSSSPPDDCRTVVINQALCDQPEFQQVLFGRHTEQQCRTLHFWCLQYWGIIWLAIAGYVQGLYDAWLVYPVVAVCCLRHTVNAHDCNHLKDPLPFLYRLNGYGLFCAGFMPFAPVFGDVALQHINVHHKETKAVLDHDDADAHSRLARMPMWKMFLSCSLMPGHCSLEDIVLHQWLKNPTTPALWTERVATNAFHWTQLLLLYKLVGPAVFWNILTAGHVGMVILWVFFNGFIHREGFFRFLLQRDPSGMRRIHPLVDGLFKLLSPNAWLEIKWHDVHHAMHIANSTFGNQMARGVTFQQIDEACAELVDRGIFLDAETKEPVSVLARSGHQLGSRRAYLQAHSEKKPVKSE